MPAFVYSPVTGQREWANNIAQLMEAQGAAQAQGVLGAGQAQAAGQVGAGQAYGQAIGQIGQTVGADIQRMVSPQYQAAQQQVSDLKSLDRAFTMPGGRDAILNALPGHLRPQVSASFAAADEAQAKVNEANLKAEDATNQYVFTLADSVKMHDYDPAALQLALSHAKQTFSSNPSLVNQIAPLEAALHANPTPDGVRSIVDPIIKLHESQEKPVVLPATPSGGAPAQLVRPGTGEAIATGPPAPAQPMTAEQVAQDAATLGTPQETPTAANSKRAMDLQKAQRNPPSLEEQYLSAKAAGDTDRLAAIEATWKAQAAAHRDPTATAQLEALRALSTQAAQARLDELNVGSDKNQQKFEQEYRTVLQRGLSSRSGGLGLEDAKVQQANHLLSLLDQNYDPKSGEWNIPRVQLNELALGLARLVSPGGQAGEQMLKEFQQRTAKGDVAGALTYLTGEPIAANTQAITKYLSDSIKRQGQTAETNREGEMRYLRGLAPTDLSEERRNTLEANSLNPLRQSRIIQNRVTGERKLQVSTDGGKTWQ